MWPLIMHFVRTNAVYMTFPVALVVGFVGYNFEAVIGRAESPWKTKSIQEERDERQFKELKEHSPSDVPSLKSKMDIPKTVLNRNDKSQLNH